MKLLLTHIALLLYLTIDAQTYNFDYFLNNAEINSPLINKKVNDNKLINLNMQKIKSILNKPFVSFESNLLFAPIISHDNQPSFQFVSDGTTSNYTGYDLSYSNGGQYQAYISVKQNLFLNSTYQAYSKTADIARLLNENDIRLTQHELKQLVAHQYLLCLKAEQQRQISKTLLNALKEQLQIMQKLVKKAIYKQSDLMLMKIEIDNYNIDYQNYTSDYKRNLDDLNLLCGINNDSLIKIENINFSLSSDSIEKSQFLLKYDLESSNIQARQLLSEQKYKARVNWFANAGLNAIYLPSFNRLGFAMGFNLSWTIFDGHQKKIQNEKSLIEQETLNFEKQQFINQYQINKRKYLTEIKAIDSKLKIIQNQLLEYKKIADLYKIQLSQGQLSIMDLKNVVRDISAKKQEELNLKIQQQLLINSYNYWNF